MLWLSWSGESVWGRGGVEGVLVYPGRLDLCGLGWFGGGLGWFGCGLGWFGEVWGGLGCFNGPNT